MVWPCLKVLWFSKDNPTGHSERKKKKRQTEEEVGRQYQRVDRNGLLPAQLVQLKTGQDGKGLLQIHLWCPDDLPRLWDRIELLYFDGHIYSSTVDSRYLDLGYLE